MMLRRTYLGTDDLRSTRRFSVTLPVRFEWAVEDSPIKRARGISRDISTRGVYLTTRTAPPVGARIQLEIEVPRRSETRHMRLQGEGLIVRVEEAPPGSANSETGIAAEVHFYAETSHDVLLSLVSQQARDGRVRHSEQGGAGTPTRGPALVPGIRVNSAADRKPPADAS